MIAHLLLAALVVQDVSFEERKLGVRPEGSAQSDTLFSPDGRGVAWMELQDGKWFVHFGDRKHEAYDDISDLGWRPDGKGVAYAARTGKTWRVVVGDEKGDPCDAVKNLKFSRDGRVVAYEARQGKVCRMVVNGKPGEPYEQVNYIEFGPDGRCAYAARKGDDWFLISNDTSVGPFEDVDPYEFSGKTLWYKSAKGGKQFFTVGEATSGPFEDLGTFCVSPDGPRVVLGIVEGGKGFLLVDGQKQPAGMSEVHEIVLGSDGKTFAYHGGDRKTSRIVMGDWKSPEIPAFGLGYLTIAPGGKDAACQVLRRDEQRVWHGELGESFEEIRQLKFNPTGEVCYRGTKDGRDVLVMGRRRHFECDTLWSYLFTPSGKLVLSADAAKKGIVRVGDKTFGPYDAVSGGLSLSPDGKKVAFGATIGRELWWKVVPVD